MIPNLHWAPLMSYVVQISYFHVQNNIFTIIDSACIIRTKLSQIDWQQLMIWNPSILGKKSEPSVVLKRVFWLPPISWLVNQPKAFWKPLVSPKIRMAITVNHYCFSYKNCPWLPYFSCDSRPFPTKKHVDPTVPTWRIQTSFRFATEIRQIFTCLGYFRGGCHCV